MTRFYTILFLQLQKCPCSDKLTINCPFSGKITYYTEPPEVHSMSSHVTAEIVTEMSRAFDIDTLFTQEAESLKGLFHLLP